MLQAIDLTKRYEDQELALDALNLEIKEGEIFFLLGANGAGKTTAMKILCGLSSPTSGKVMVAGYDVYHQSEMIKKRIGYMSQRFSLFEDLSGWENFQFFGGIYGLPAAKIRERTTELLGRLGLESEKNQNLGSLPLGWKQKLAFSVAIIHQPSIVFLDEPTGGVDPITRRQFWEIIYETASQGITVFVTTHYMDEAEYCQRVSIMADGRIVALDTPANLKAKYKAANIEEVFLKIARG